MRLEIKGVHKSYVQGGSHIEVLKGLDLDLDGGDTLAILGESGSGKSTLLSLLSGLDRPDRGTIRIAGEAVETLSEEALSRFRGKHIGIVFQQFHLVSTLTALENVRLPLEFSRHPGADAAAREALANVGLSHRLSHFPSQLSGGECQRVAIARALVVQPKLLLADEPSGNLDESTGRQVMDCLFEMASRQKTTLVLVTHNETLADRCRQRKKLLGGVLQ